LSIVATLIVIFYFRRPGISMRTLALVAGMGFFAVGSTTYVIQLMFAATSASHNAIAIHYFVDFSAEVIVWILNFWWAIQALGFSVQAGDWSNTKWAKNRNRKRFGDSGST
jgi:hypothetical protein